jgi:hypothetical protein
MRRLWRALIRWLADDMITEAYGAGVQTGRMENRSEAFAHGQVAGRAELNDELHRVVAGRSHGQGDYVNPEDLKLAMKGLLH